MIFEGSVCVLFFIIEEFLLKEIIPQFFLIIRVKIRVSNMILAYGNYNKRIFWIAPSMLWLGFIRIVYGTNFLPL